MGRLHARALPGHAKQLAVASLATKSAAAATGLARARRSPALGHVRGLRTTGPVLQQQNAVPPFATPGEAEASLVGMAEALQESPELATELVARMDPRSLQEIARVWATCKAVPATPPQSWQLRRYAMLSALPMVGFGFFDNFIMIFGEGSRKHVHTACTIRRPFVLA